ncbi:DUF3530 family protein [Pseudomonas zhanjiangensis]|uniref:DUF3530 family protein n=1 Tax=Pseudomonas zhanjiangensis TaxID=3239015 RepID=A0ABV3YRP9_9PSED
MRHPLSLLLLALSLLPLGAPLPVAASGEADAAGENTAGTDAPAAAPTRPAQPERSAAAAAALAEFLPAQEQQQLQTDEESFLALWLPANTAQAHGVVVLVGGDGETPDWPTSLGPLRRKLPDIGWHSLALGLPDPLDSLAQARPLASTDTPGETPATDEPATPAEGAEVAAATAEMAATEQEAPTDPAARHARRIDQRIGAALALARQQQAKRIALLGHGSGAYWAARYLDENSPGDVQYLLMVAVEQPTDLVPSLDEVLARLDLATGDFYYGDRPAARDAAKRRAQASRRRGEAAYSQVALKAVPGNPAQTQEQSFRRLRGWLERQLKAH